MLQDPHALVVPDGTEVVNRRVVPLRDYERVFIPKSVTEIQREAFYNCYNLKEVAIEEGSRLKTIEDSAFCFCRNLAKITLPDGLETIGGCAFLHSSLESVIFPASLRTIGQTSFASCKSLKVVKFNDGLEVLGTSEKRESEDILSPGVFNGSGVESV